MSGYWEFETARGPVYIVPKADRFHVIYEGESLGSYATPNQAADDAADGHTFAPSNGADFAALDIPSGIDGWTFVRKRFS